MPRDSENIAGADYYDYGAAGTAVVAASGNETPTDIIASLTGRSQEEVQAEKQERDVTYGAMAAEAGELEAFRSEMVELRDAQIQARVDEGTMSPEEAEQLRARISQNIENCDGTGNATGQKAGGMFGNKGQGSGEGLGQGGANGSGKGAKGIGGGQGQGLRDGSCGQ
ncbi:MAG TPA: hypothetical protein GXZ67_07625 [Clostridiaceae bacterium]|nr:hypothetical protein [Clostridiaceae bacterium]